MKFANIYRLTVDNGQTEDISDYTNILDAEAAFLKASRRKDTFSAQVQQYSGETFEPLGGLIYKFGDC